MTADLPLLPAPPDPPPGGLTGRATRFGISTKLQAAFGVVAGLTVIAAAVAFLSFDTMEQRLAAGDRPAGAGDDRCHAAFGHLPRNFGHGRALHQRPDRDGPAHPTLAAIEDKRVDLATVLGRMKTMNGESAALATFVDAVAAAGCQSCGPGRGDHATHRAAGARSRSCWKRRTASTPKSSTASADLSNRNQALEIGTRPTFSSA